jgi:hypothetical protein
MTRFKNSDKLATMLQLLSCMLVLVVGGGMGHAPSCSEPAHRRMQERFTACRSAHARAYHESGGKGGAASKMLEFFFFISASLAFV